MRQRIATIHLPRRAGMARMLSIGALAMGALLTSAAADSRGAPATAPGQLYAFGENYFGQLGNSLANKEQVPHSTPALVTLPGATGPVTELASGQDHSLVVTSTGQLYAFGLNYYGQLGSVVTNEESSPNPTPVLVTLPGATGPVAHVAAGQDHSLAVTSTGQLYGFGENDHGQLGNTTNNSSEKPSPTPTLVTLPGATGTVSQVAAGEAFSLAVTSAGQLFAFGENQYGQLGNTDNTGSEANPNPTPTLVTLPGATGPVTEVAAGEAHSLVVTATGQLYAFGYNAFGQLGLPASGAPNPTPTQVTLPGATGPVTQVAAGDRHSLALTATGQLYAFGENVYGQLGKPANGEPNATPELVTLPGASGPITQIAAGTSHSLVVTSTGQLYAFGSNQVGQLGIPERSGTSEPTPTPTPVGFGAGTTIDTVARGSQALDTLALVADMAVTNATLPAGQEGVPYTASGSVAGGTAPYSWSARGLPAGLAIDPADGRIAGTPSVPGGFGVTLTVSDRYGNVATGTVITLTIAPAVPGLTRAGLTHTRFRVGRTNTAVSARKGRRTPAGTSFLVNLSVPATLQIAITRTAPGLLRSRSCLAPTQELRRKHAKRCTRVVTVGILTRSNEPAGSTSVAFSGRIGRRPLLPGAYRALLQASNVSGRSRAVALAFTVVR